MILFASDTYCIISSMRLQGGRSFMENDNNLEVFSSISIPKAVMKNALPAMVAMLMVLVYNLADTFLLV